MLKYVPHVQLIALTRLQPQLTLPTADVVLDLHNAMTPTAVKFVELVTIAQEMGWKLYVHSTITVQKVVKFAQRVLI